MLKHKAELIMCLEYCHILLYHKFLNEGMLIIMVKITLTRPCMCEGYWVATVNAKGEAVRCEGSGEYDMVLMRH